MFNKLLVLCVFGQLAVSQMVCPTPPIRNGAAKLKKRGRKIKYKCYRDFTLVGPVTARCVNGAWRPNTVPICVATGCVPQPKVENADAKELEFFGGSRVPPGSVLMYVCNPGHQLEGDSLVWCDGLLWNASAPLCTLPYSPPRLSCSFNDVDVPATCGWSQNSSDTAVWELTNLTASTPGTGPSSAFDGSFYMLLDSSDYKVNSTARFVSPVLTSNYSVDRCILFTFHMKGVDMGILRVGQGPDGLQDNLTVLEEYKGDYGTTWNLGLVNLVPTRENFQIYFEGVVGRSYLSDIGLDSIRITNGTVCGKISSGYMKPVPRSTRELSPISCWGRCRRDMNEVAAEERWMEGVCDCNSDCLLGSVQCCDDYLAECLTPKSAPKVELSGWLTWSTIAVVACLFVVGVLITVTIVRRRRVRPERMDGDGDDMCRMVEEEPEPENRNQQTLEVEQVKQRRFSDLEDIDFSLASPNVQTSRKITSI